MTDVPPSTPSLIRRAFLGAAVGVGQNLLLPCTHAETPSVARVLGPDEGEHLIHFRDRGNIYIKASAGTMALGTQQITRGAGIPIHRHPHTDEAFQVLRGSGMVTLDDVPHAIESGATIFISRNTWHGFANPAFELLVMWIVAPAGLDAFFRETCSAPGQPPRQLSRDQIREIALKHGTEFR